jgi:PPM family protein phosphatase
MNFTIQVAGRTDVGCVRRNNEDSYGYDTEHGIFVVCDGMGGEAAGEVASKIAVTTVLSYFRDAGANGGYPAIGRTFEGASPNANALASAIQLANQAIRQSAMNDSRKTGMGTTIVAALVRDSEVSIANVGDSRIYLVRDHKIRQLTNDHSLVMEQVRRGLMTAEEAGRSELQNVIVRALGLEQGVEPDLADLDVHPEDTLLFCSDGLFRHLSDAQIVEVLTSTSTVEEACDCLIEAAKLGGGSDNITCVLVRLVAQPWFRKMFSAETPKSEEPS